MQNGELGTFLQGSLQSQRKTGRSNKGTMQGVAEKISEDILEEDEILYEAEKGSKQMKAIQSQNEYFDSQTFDKEDIFNIFESHREKGKHQKKKRRKNKLIQQQQFQQRNQPRFSRRMQKRRRPQTANPRFKRNKFLKKRNLRSYLKQIKPRPQTSKRKKLNIPNFFILGTSVHIIPKSKRNAFRKQQQEKARRLVSTRPMSAVQTSYKKKDMTIKQFHYMKQQYPESKNEQHEMQSEQQKDQSQQVSFLKQNFFQPDLPEIMNPKQQHPAPKRLRPKTAKNRPQTAHNKSKKVAQKGQPYGIVVFDQDYFTQTSTKQDKGAKKIKYQPSAPKKTKQIAESNAKAKLKF